jgi:hypothetical protein
MCTAKGAGSAAAPGHRGLDMDQDNEDLRAVSDDLVADAKRVAEIETAKGQLELGDPRLPALAAETERLARGMVSKSVAERELVDDASSPAG